MEQASRIRDWCILIIILSFISQQVTSQVLICDSNPCFNDGSCYEFSDRFFCICYDGFLEPRCTKDLCVSNPCMNGGTCMNDVMTEDYSCNCTTGFTGKNCSDPVVSDPCDSNPCSNGGTCDSTSQGFTCTCRAGFTGVTCSGTVMSDPCIPNPCENGGTCESTIQPMCMCTAGYTGSTCSDNAVMSDPCIPNPCKNGGTCDSTKQPICMCTAEYTGSTCSDNAVSDPCDSNPCSNGGTCGSTNQGFTCTCRAGSTGVTCSETVMSDPCIPPPCENGGTCDSTIQPICMCTAGYTGSTCSDNDPCVPNPCLNGGTCYMNDEMAEDFSCSCATGFTGKNCTDPATISESSGPKESSPTEIIELPRTSKIMQTSDSDKTETNNGGTSLWIVIVAVAVIQLQVLAFVGLLWYRSRSQKGGTAHPDKQDNNGTDVRGNQLVNHHGDVNDEMVFNVDPKYYSVEDGEVKIPTYALPYQETVNNHDSHVTVVNKATIKSKATLENDHLKNIQHTNKSFEQIDKKKGIVENANCKMVDEASMREEHEYSKKIFTEEKEAVVFCDRGPQYVNYKITGHTSS